MQEESTIPYPSGNGDTGKRKKPPGLVSPSGNKSRGGNATSLPKLSKSAMRRTESAPNPLGSPPSHLVSMLRRDVGSFSPAHLDADGQVVPRGRDDKVLPPIRMKRGSVMVQGVPVLDNTRPHNMREVDPHITWNEEGDGLSFSMDGVQKEVASPTPSARAAAASEAVAMAARKVCDDIERVQEEIDEFKKRQAASARKPVCLEAMDDPVLQRAMEVADIAKRKYTRQWKDGSREETEETATLREIHSVTRGVNEKLKQVMEDLWRTKVRTKPIDKSAEFDKHPDMEQEEDENAEVVVAGDAQDTGPKKKAMVELTKDVEEVDGLPNLKDRLKSVNNEDGFSQQEIKRIRTAFSRFKLPGTWDLHRDSLTKLLSYLGHVMTKGDGIWDIYAQITVYDYLDFDEFLGFMDQYVVWERVQFQQLFAQYDEDGSGEMSRDELRTLTASLGIVPLKGMMDEAMALVDEDGSEELSFDEYVKFIIVYRHCEGFTRAEVKELRKSFDKLSEESKDEGKGMALPIASMTDGLVRVFGMQIEEFSTALTEEIMGGPEVADGAEPEGLAFGEFLIYARRAREAQHTSLEEMYGLKAPSGEGAMSQSAKVCEFSLNDEDGSGGISLDEVLTALRANGYEPLRCVVQEVLHDVMEGGWSDDRELDFDEFFDFILVYNKRDGFLKTEVEELMQVYYRFDEDGSEEISGVELADIFRFLGYTPTLEEVSHFVAEVDVNGSNALDPREFLQLMQMHRKTEIGKVRKVFESFAGKAVNTKMSKGTMPSALSALGHGSSVSEVFMKDVPKEGHDFFDFMIIADHCRSAWMAKQRKKAGYSEAELEHFQDLFNKFDKDRSGDIDAKELITILNEFGWAPINTDERNLLMERLDKARKLCRECGVQEVSKLGSSDLRYWEFVQLCRLLQKQKDTDEEEYMAKLMVTLKFSLPEIDQFRQVFNTWINIDKEDDAPPPDPSVKNVPQKLSRDLVRRLLRSLGCKLTPGNALELDKQTNVLEDASKNLAFDAFLKLMRWVLDSNFSDINGTDAAKKAKNAPSS